MPNIPDKDIDQIFRQAAENQSINYNDHAWQNMVQKLDQPSGFFRPGHRVWIFLLASITILGISWWLIPKTDSFKKNQEKAFKKASPLKHLSIPPDENANIGVDRGNPTTKKRHRAILEQQNENGTSLLADDHSASGPEGQMARQPLAEINAINPAGIDNLLIETPSKHLSLSSGGTDIITKPVGAARYFTLGFNISPDLSGIGLNTFSRVGASVGLSLEYNLNTWISINTGIFYADKVYSVGDTQYGYGSAKTADKINGTCIVLDIPVNVRMNLINGMHSRFFFTGGLSSYFMLSEKYEYIYQYGQDYQEVWRNENQHIIGLANISLGYEHDLGRSWSLQVEPYLKLPITEIGGNQLKLLSTGGFIAIRKHFRVK